VLARSCAYEGEAIAAHEVLVYICLTKAALPRVGACLVEVQSTMHFCMNHSLSLSAFSDNSCTSRLPPIPFDCNAHRHRHQAAAW